MPTATASHPTDDALAILLPVCDGARSLDDCGLNKFDAASIKDYGIPRTRFDKDRWAKRLAKYHRQLPADLVDELKHVAAEREATKSAGGSTVETDVTVCKHNGTHFILKGIYPSNKDHYKAVAEKATGKKCLVWSQDPDTHGLWIVHRKFVSALLATGEFLAADDVTEDDYRYMEPPKTPGAAPAVPVNTSNLVEGTTLRPFQAAGVSTVVNGLADTGTGFLLADDMGLGKSLECLVVAESFAGPVAVVCPAPLRYTWVREIFKFVKDRTVCVVNDKFRYQDLLAAFGSDIKRFRLIPDQADYIIMSYEAARGFVCGNPDPITSRYHTMKMVTRPEVEPLFSNRMLVCDEAHRGKNHAAKRSQAIYALARTAQRVIASTGTPIDNRPEEMWSMLCLTHNWNLFKGKDEFMGMAAQGQSGLLKIHERLAVSGKYLRRLKKDVLQELPPKQRQDFICQMTPRQSAEYESLRQGLKRVVHNGTAMTKQITCILAILTEMQTKANECKVEPVYDELVDRWASEKFTVVACNRLEPLRSLKTKLDAACIPTAVLCGETGPLERAAIVQDFQDGKLFVILTTLAEGITLTRADQIILMDLPWTPGKTSQFEDRIYRIGQQEHITVVRVLAASIDEHKAAIISKKQAIIDAAVDGGDSALSEDSILEQVVRKLTD